MKIKIDKQEKEEIDRTTGPDGYTRYLGAKSVDPDSRFKYTLMGGSSKDAYSNR